MSTYMSIYAVNGAPMQEATLCDRHFDEGCEQAEDVAASAEDFMTLGWHDSSAAVKRHEVSCFMCDWDRFIDEQEA